MDTTNNYYHYHITHFNLSDLYKLFHYILLLNPHPSVIKHNIVAFYK